jgi:hypothetical protein
MVWAIIFYRLAVDDGQQRCANKKTTDDAVVFLLHHKPVLT